MTLRSLISYSRKAIGRYFGIGIVYDSCDIESIVSQMQKEQMQLKSQDCAEDKKLYMKTI